MNNRVENFSKELSDLTKKYGIAIGGCGCCGSPYLDDLNVKDFKNIKDIELGDCLSYNKQLGIYEVDND